MSLSTTIAIYKYSGTRSFFLKVRPLEIHSLQPSLRSKSLEEDIQMTTRDTLLVPKNL